MVTPDSLIRSLIAAPLRTLTAIQPNGPENAEKDLTPISSVSANGWFNLGTLIREPFAGAWQRGQEQRSQNLAAFGAVFACVTRIAQDISKMQMRLMEKDRKNGIWSETVSPAFSPLLRKPNPWQTTIQFFEQWMISKLVDGNVYVIMFRDDRKVVRQMFVLNPNRVRPLVSDAGEVYYEVAADPLAQIGGVGIRVPASEIIHDRINCLYHPLIGQSPITACAVAAENGLNIQRNSSRFFTNYSRPAGVLVSPGRLSQDQIDQTRAEWEANYGGENAYRTAVLGNGLEYKAIGIKASDAQLIEQLQWDERNVCTAFGVPGYMIGVGTEPKYDNIEALSQQYYSQCLQAHIEGIEACMDVALGLLDPSAQGGKLYGTEFDLDGLLRMDTMAMARAESELVKAAIKAPNESRARLGLPPKPGGDSPLAQQQNYSLAALAKRDAMDNPFAAAGGAASPSPPDPAVTPPAEPAPPPDPGPSARSLLAMAVMAKQSRRRPVHAPAAVD